MQGVNVFVYDWYWYEGGPYLESALNDGFLKGGNNKKMQFYIMWANHDVKYNCWNYYRYKDNEDIQCNQGGGSVMSEDAAMKFANSVKTMDFNSIAMYNMGGLHEDYIVYGNNSVRIREQMDSILDIPVFPCLSIV